MKITFPHMGNLYLAAKALVEELELDYVMPPVCNKETLKLGTRYAPESACLPLKILTGFFMQAHQMGADTVLMLGAWGPCRFDYYCEMQREIIEEAGFKMDNIILELSSSGLHDSLSRFRKLAGGIKPLKLTRAIRGAGEIAFLVDEVERLYYLIKPREAVKGESDRIYKSLRKEALSRYGAKDIKELLVKAKNELLDLKLDNSSRPLRIGVVGEIYGSIDPFASLYIQEKLADLGVVTERMITISQWISDNLINKVKKDFYVRDYHEAAKPYINTDSPLGGHTRETLGNTVLFAQRDFDGVIQLYPLGCMPEIVAQAILPKVSIDHDIPVLTLITDEMTGDSGYQTRMEAFLDLLSQRREVKDDHERLLTGQERE